MRNWIPLFFVAIAVAIALLHLAAMGFANEGGVAPIRVDRDAVVQHASARGPGMLVARAGRASAERTREAAVSTLSFPPRMELEVARHTYPGGDGMDVTAALWQDLSLGGLGKAKRGYAQASAEIREWEMDLAWRHAIHQGLLAWIEALHGRSLLALRTESTTLAEQTQTITRARVRAGAVPPVELSLAAAVTGGARASLLDAKSQVVEADATLRHALGIHPATPMIVVGDLTRSKDLPIDERAELERVQRDHPLVKLALTQARFANARAELEASRGRPVLGVGVSYAREAKGDRIYGAMVSVPLPLMNPHALEIAESRGQAEIASMRAREVGVLLARELRAALRRKAQARELRSALEEGAVIPGREALREVLKRYEAGEVGLVETLSIRRELIAVEEATLAAHAEVLRADAVFSYLTGRPVPETLP